MQANYLDTSNPLRILTISNPPLGLAMWNFLTSCRSIITSFITWEIHDGKSVKFWEDSWNGKPPLENIQELQYVRVVLSREWGEIILDYVHSIEGLTGKII